MYWRFMIPMFSSLLIGVFIGLALESPNPGVAVFQILIWLWVAHSESRRLSRRNPMPPSQRPEASYLPLDRDGHVNLKKNDDPTWM